MVCTQYYGYLYLGKYLGEELTKTFEKNELWGLTIFLLHEYYKEIAGKGESIQYQRFLEYICISILVDKII
jgi:hypothetical protein